MSDQAVTVWRCSVCGYVHRGAEPPECCPVCGAAAEDFEPAPEESGESAAVATSHWQCLNCNYVHEGPSAPEFCPICGVPSDRFRPLEEAPSVQSGTTEALRMVVVGGGIAGVSACESARQAAPHAAITFLCEEPVLPYYRLNLTRYLAGEIGAASLPIHESGWYEERGIRLIPDARVRSLDTASGVVQGADGSVHPYDRLILAMGSHPYVPPLPGIDLPGVYVLRTASDADAILARVASGARVVIIGGGILGLEAAGALARRKGTVTLLESHDRLMPRQLNRRGAELMEERVAGLGIRLRKRARSRAVQGDGAAVGVLLEDGSEIPADTVLITTGVRPNTYLARKAGLEVNQGIVVDNRLRTSDPRIFAAGDVAEHRGVLYGAWGPAMYQGAIAGMNAAGGEAAFGGMPRSNTIKVLGVDLVSVGMTEAPDGSYATAEAEEGGGRYAGFILRDGRLTGAVLIGYAGLSSAVRDAVESGRDFSEIPGGPGLGAAVLGKLGAGADSRS